MVWEFFFFHLIYEVPACLHLKICLWFPVLPKEFGLWLFINATLRVSSLWFHLAQLTWSLQTVWIPPSHSSKMKKTSKKCQNLVMGILAYEIWHIKQPSNMPAKGAPILKDSSVSWNYLNIYLSFGWAKLRMSAFLCAGICLEMKQVAQSCWSGYRSSFNVNNAKLELPYLYCSSICCVSEGNK